MWPASLGQWQLGISPTTMKRRKELRWNCGTGMWRCVVQTDNINASYSWYSFFMYSWKVTGKLAEWRIWSSSASTLRLLRRRKAKLPLTINHAALDHGVELEACWGSIQEGRRTQGYKTITNHLIFIWSVIVILVLLTNISTLYNYFVLTQT